MDIRIQEKASLITLLLIVAATLPYINSLFNGFVWDDKQLILLNKSIRKNKGVKFLLLPNGLVLADYGGDTEKDRCAYRKQLIADIAEGLDVKGDIFGHSIFGSEEFIYLVKATFLAALLSLSGCDTLQQTISFPP